MFELKTFQGNAAQLICDRYSYFANHENRPITRKFARPFFQALSAITGAGKTPILAQAVSLMRNESHCEPIVLWMSKARSVVQQTYNNFAGGKYSSLLDEFKVCMVTDLTPHMIADSRSPLLVLTTTGLFNNKDQEAGSLNIYKRSQDKQGERSIWERLIERRDGKRRRPLIVVYDEGHNLSEQQTTILSELEPEAYLLASATLKLPSTFQQSVIHHVKLWVDENRNDEAFSKLQSVEEAGKHKAELFVTTGVHSRDVVEAQLIKKAIQFDGTTAAMERSLDELIERMALLRRESEKRSLGIGPKAIYVCRTNVNDDGTQDDPTAPFHMRNAPPIKIWRYLVENKKVAPSDIAIYADLKFQGKSKPEMLNLFSKGEDDFDLFHEGDFKHIIFNLSLQEGWDDPACYLAYIDKSMGSNIQVEQIIGRVLRQPGAEHYDNPLLNSAHFFLRVDNKNVFNESIERIKQKLDNEGSPVVITSTFSSGSKPRAEEIGPRSGVKASLYHVYIDSQYAQRKIRKVLATFPHFQEGDANSVGVAETASKVLDLTDNSSTSSDVEWMVDGETNPVRIRWLMNNAIRAHTAQALKIVDLKDSRFDVRVQIRSIADQKIRETAQQIADAYYEDSELTYETSDPFEFGPIRVLNDSAVKFKYAVYPKYSGFNEEELTFAKALDKAKVTWHRNSVSGGFRIPLLMPGDTDNFYPDFLAWKGSAVFALETKGKHLLSDAIARKLFDIFEGARKRLHVRFIAKGRQSDFNGPRSGKGFTVWRIKGNAPKGFYAETIDETVVESLKK